MIIKEAEKRYGKEIAMDIWGCFNLNTIKVEDTPYGLDIAEQEWESTYQYLIDNRYFE